MAERLEVEPHGTEVHDLTVGEATARGGIDLIKDDELMDYAMLNEKFTR